MKWIGALLILLATTWTGFETANRLSERPRQLRQLKTALQALEAEIMYGHTPLSEAALHLANQLPLPLSRFFQQFAETLQTGETSVKEAWQESLQSIWGATALKHGEFEVMKQFGETLGQYDRMAQQKQIALAIVHLEREEQDALEKKARYEKMAKSLGLLTGLLIIILLI
ncbi:stage III sporulation protein AB [Anoxybacillus sp. B7M1]|jgi:stage III sporulation protein AB|uniref:stage III sporulation protein SpoIIIAB n=1 Tax=unclassified Anoxybacillus TaxID=2639704 RepID=UPI0005CD8EF5|nr:MULTISPECIES: stage III sporulation protein SpoIIIAB [unclassified Anoxybacillus]ANB56094.1 stage III sporulation protein AB [Anoxybacillus sp. B2M1]ANB64994.1 stage III sporulation protein AB [Anoxybacillus sp. B7M1]